MSGILRFGIMKLVRTDLSSVCGQHIVILCSQCHIPERLQFFSQNCVSANNADHLRTFQMLMKIEKSTALRNRRKSLFDCIFDRISHFHIV